MDRMVEIYKFERLKGNTKFDKVFDVSGKFIQYGVDYEELENGPGCFSTAIVEMADGTVKNVNVGMIKFTDKGE